MSFIRVNEVGGDSLERVNKLLHNIPGGVYKAAFSALRRAGDTAKTRAGQFAAAEYTINKGEFMRRVHSTSMISQITVFWSRLCCSVSFKASKCCW